MMVLIDSLGFGFRIRRGIMDLSWSRIRCLVGSLTLSVAPPCPCSDLRVVEIYQIK